MSTSLKMAPGHGWGGQLTGMACFAIQQTAWLLDDYWNDSLLKVRTSILNKQLMDLFSHESWCWKNWANVWFFWLHARSNCKWVTKWLLGWLEPRQGFLTLKFKSCRNLWFHPCQLHEDLIQGLYINIQMSILYYVKSQYILNIIQNSLFSNKHPFLHHGLFHHSRAALRRRQVHWQHRVCGGRMDWGRAWWKGRKIWMVENVGSQP